MREECKHFQSRTYADGEVARFCVLDLAPEAPWRCPDDCPSYERRLADAAWVHGSLVSPPVEEEPKEAASEEAAGLLDAAEDIVESVGPEVLAEVEKQERAQQRRSGRRTASNDPSSDDGDGWLPWWRKRRNR